MLYFCWISLPTPFVKLLFLEPTELFYLDLFGILYISCFIAIIWPSYSAIIDYRCFTCMSYAYLSPYSVVVLFTDIFSTLFITSSFINLYFYFYRPKFTISFFVRINSFFVLVNSSSHTCNYLLRFSIWLTSCSFSLTSMVTFLYNCFFSSWSSVNCREAFEVREFFYCLKLF